MSGKPKLEWCFAVTVCNRIAFQNGEAHIYSTIKGAEIGARMVKAEIGEMAYKYVQIVEINIDKLNSIVE